MRGFNKWFAIISILFIAIILIFKGQAPQTIDWSEQYTIDKNRPFDISIFVENITTGSEAFQSIDTIKKDLYQYLHSDNNITKVKTGNHAYLFINDYYEQDATSNKYLDSLLTWGNDVFIAANNVNFTFDSSIDVHFDYKYNYKAHIDTFRLFHDDSYFTLANKRIISAVNMYNNNDYELIGYFVDNLDTFDNVIRFKKGNGYLYLITTPQIFANVTLMNTQNVGYLEKILSFSKAQHLILHNNNPTSSPNDQVNRNKLQYIFKNPYIKSAWFLLIIGTLILVIFTAKRKQRIIPIIQAKENQSLQLAQLFANHHYHNNNYLGIAKKRIHFLVEYLKQHHNIQYDINEVNSIENLSNQTAISLELSKKLFDEISMIESRTLLSKYELIQFNKTIEDIYQQL